MDFSYFDNYTEDKPDLFSPAQQMSEIEQLKTIADRIGSYIWQYKPEAGLDTEDHMGPVAQELLGIPGLDAAVIKEAGQPLKLDTNYLACACLGLIAALARHTLFEEGTNDGQKRQDYNNNVEGQLPTDTSGTDTGAGATDTNGATGTGAVDNANLQPGMAEV